MIECWPPVVNGSSIAALDLNIMNAFFLNFTRIVENNPRIYWSIIWGIAASFSVAGGRHFDYLLCGRRTVCVPFGATVPPGERKHAEQQQPADDRGRRQRCVLGRFTGSSVRRL